MKPRSQGWAALPGVFYPTASELQLQRQLNNPAPLRTGYSSEIRTQANTGRIEYRRVRKVDELASELDPLVLEQGEEFLEAHIQSVQPRPANSSDSAGAEAGRRRSAVSVRVEPLETSLTRHGLPTEHLGLAGAVGGRAP